MATYFFWLPSFGGRIHPLLARERCKDGPLQESNCSIGVHRSGDIRMEHDRSFVGCRSNANWPVPTCVFDGSFNGVEPSHVVPRVHGFSFLLASSLVLVVPGTQVLCISQDRAPVRGLAWMST